MSSLIVPAESGGAGKEGVDALREGEDIVIAFNAKYLLDVLGILDREGVRTSYLEAPNQYLP